MFFKISKLYQIIEIKAELLGRIIVEIKLGSILSMMATKVSNFLRKSVTKN